RNVITFAASSVSPILPRGIDFPISLEYSSHEEFGISLFHFSSICLLRISPIHTVLTRILYFPKSLLIAFVNANPAERLTVVGRLFSLGVLAIDAVTFTIEPPYSFKYG